MSSMNSFSNCARSSWLVASCMVLMVVAASVAELPVVDVVVDRFVQSRVDFSADVVRDCAEGSSCGCLLRELLSGEEWLLA